ncbi:MAG: hypothetical protein MAG451_00067 [Anaerolineales bacterium]|nr:hypothetical protein [Anaerolineales bacterium]
MLRLHVVQAEHGDCLILEHGSPEASRYILIDGGPAHTYEDHLRDQLLAIRDAGGKLELAILSHVDDDHVNGLLDLMDELRDQRSSRSPETVSIDALWHNTFSQTLGGDIENRFRTLMAEATVTRSVIPFSDKAERSIRQGDELTRLARELDVPLNREFLPRRLIALEDAPAPIAFGKLSFHVVGPTEGNLQKLRDEWLEWLEEQERDVLVRDPIAAERAARAADRSIPNLSSIMFLAEADGKTILFTGDGRGDHLLEGLEEAGLLEPDGNLHVDVLKVPHHGSARNVTPEFFRTLTAGTYVICANGKHDNPDLDTLEWIVEAAGEQERAVEIVVTNATESTRRLVHGYPPDECGYRLAEIRPEEHVRTLNLTA